MSAAPPTSTPGADGPRSRGTRAVPAPEHRPSGLLGALSAIPGVLRAWPARNGQVTFECRDQEGRLRAGILDPRQGEHRLLPYADDPSLPALSPGLGGRLVVHRAGRRAVVLGPDRVSKLTRPGRARPSPASLEAFEAFTRMGLRVPGILRADEDRIDLELVPGRSLAELGDAGLPGWQRLARVWSRLGPAGASLPLHSPAHEARVLRDWYERAAGHGLLEEATGDPHAGPALGRAVEEACADLEAGGEQSPGPALTLCHRDLHDGQLLWDGRDLSLIDLDTPALAEAALDLGNLMAHAELMALQGRLSPQGHDRVQGLLEDMAAASPTTGARLRAYHHGARLRLIFVHAFRPGARAWLPRWTSSCLAAPSSIHDTIHDTTDGSTSCV
ncbi:phosphotransferase [Actinomyces bowdenii]|uniref:Serine kinase n=1 Tax=Actinomyces bowdenii TaxID=131109 RepID=A0A3P1UUK5_9ACTO|nr:phosphotransferase [Actinomyces bowdenii]RRD25649.1 serine kinase [Actinomyces bowdenii]